MKRKSRYVKVTAIMLCTSFLFSCSPNADSESETGSGSEIETEEVSTAISEMVTYDEEDYYSDWESGNPTYIELNGSDASFDAASAVIASDGIITIKTSGVYVISGKLDDGQIVVDAEDKGTVRLVLNGVEINSSDNAALYVKNAENTIISLPEGTENVLSDGQEYVLEDSAEDEPNAALFSKDDLTINGTGTLTVNGNYNNGITSKDDLKITGGNIDIHATDDGLMGRDVVAVKDGNITIEAAGDGIKSTNDEKSSKGGIALEGGTFNIVAGSDGVQAATSLYITDGSYTIASGGGSPETISTNDEMMGRPGENTTETTSDEEETESAKGIKASVELAIDGGTFKIDSSDDAIHSNESITLSGGELEVASGDDGIHADASLLTTGGTITIIKSNEGIESQKITVLDGEIDVTASDDGINVGGGADGSGMGMQPGAGGNMPPEFEGSIQPDTEESAQSSTEDNTQTDTEENGQASAEDEIQSSTKDDAESSTEDNMLLTISGGHITVDASGDGLDSNGSIIMTGGTVIVNGPTANMNGSLDYNESFEISGGFLIAAGSSGMAEPTSEESTQYSVLMSYPETQAAGTLIHLKDSEGNTITTFVPSKEYQSVVISSPELTKDTSYTLYSGGTPTGSEKDGLYTEGDYQDGTKIVDFTISESVTWLNESGVTEGRSSGPGGNQTRPEGENPGGVFADLDEETREKLQTIMEQQREGTITQEEAQTQLAELGIEFPGKGAKP